MARGHAYRAGGRLRDDHRAHSTRSADEIGDQQHLGRTAENHRWLLGASRSSRSVRCSSQVCPRPSKSVTIAVGLTAEASPPSLGRTLPPVTAGPALRRPALLLLLQVIELSPDSVCSDWGARPSQMAGGSCEGCPSVLRDRHLSRTKQDPQKSLGRVAFVAQCLMHPTELVFLARHVVGQIQPGPGVARCRWVPGGVSCADAAAASSRTDPARDHGHRAGHHRASAPGHRRPAPGSALNWRTRRRHRTEGRTRWVSPGSRNCGTR